MKYICKVCHKLYPKFTILACSVECNKKDQFPLCRVICAPEDHDNIDVNCSSILINNNLPFRDIVCRKCFLNERQQKSKKFIDDCYVERKED